MILHLNIININIYRLNYTCCYQINNPIDRKHTHIKKEYFPHIITVYILQIINANMIQLSL